MRIFPKVHPPGASFKHMQRKKQTRSRQKESEYEVDKIIDKRIHDGMISYKIQWIGFPVSDATWEPIENLEKCQDMISEFEKSRKEASKLAKTHSNSKQPQPLKSLEKKKQKPAVEHKKTEQPRKAESKPPRPNHPHQTKQNPPMPTRNSKQSIPLAQSRVNTLFSGFKGDRLRSSHMEDGTTAPTETETIKFPSKGRLSGSQTAQQAKNKKKDFAGQANLKRSLASHINNQDQEYEPTRDNGRKIQKTQHYVDDEPQRATPQEIAEKLVHRFGQKPKEKTPDIKQKPTNIKDRKTQQQQRADIKSAPKDHEGSRNLKLQDEALKRPQIQADKHMFSVSRMSRVQTQDLTKAIIPSLNPNSKSKLSGMFGHMERYTILDEYLILHKRMGILNIINKDLGGRQEKPKIKMLEVGKYQLVEEELQQVKRINRETTMEKLESLIKFEEGWVAVGKNKHEGLFMMDVNLLHDHVWRVIKDMYKLQ